jgi:hypothetical protein
VSGEVVVQSLVDEGGFGKAGKMRTRDRFQLFNSDVRKRLRHGDFESRYSTHVDVELGNRELFSFESMFHDYIILFQEKEQHESSRSNY